MQKGARQPSFSNDGRLLVNLEKSPYENHIGLLDANYAWQGLVSDSPEDAYPYWNPDGNLYAFSNPQMLIDPATGEPFVYRVVSEEDQGRAGFILYSSGEDGTDDGGRHEPWASIFGEIEPGSDFVVWPRQDRGD